MPVDSGMKEEVLLAGQRGYTPAPPADQPVEWQVATLKSSMPETARVRTFTLVPEHWIAHQPGQHYDVRVTLADGRQARRSYSVASEPERTGEIDLAVERLEDGEVSAYMHDVLRPGDQIEVKGPLGNYFVWDASQGGPLLLIAGGTGVTPLMAMLRHRSAVQADIPTRLLYSVRSPADALYTRELAALVADGKALDVLYSFTRSSPSGWAGYARRLDDAILREALASFGTIPLAYIAGPTLFVQAVSTTLAALGLPDDHVLTEQFRPTGRGGGGNESDPGALS